MQVNLSGKVALVTGAAQGIGRAISVALARNGADIVLNDLDREASEALAQELRSLGRRTFVAIADVSDYPAVKHAVTEAIAQRVIFGQGPLDLLI